MAGRCDGWSSDTSQLTGFRRTYPDGPESLTIFPEVFSKEPLAPAVADGDTQWAQVVNWAIIATIQAEEFGITPANVDEMLADTEDSASGSSSGEVTGEDGACSIPGSGLPVDFAYQVVSRSGNYGEIYERAHHAARSRAWRQRAVDRRRAAVRPAVPLMPDRQPVADRPGAARGEPPGRRSGATSASCAGLPARGPRDRRARARRAGRQLPHQRRPDQHPDRLRVPRQPREVRDPRQRLPADPAGARRDRRGSPQHACASRCSASCVTTVLGMLIGIGRLSGNWLVRTPPASTSRSSATSRCSCSCSFANLGWSCRCSRAWPTRGSRFGLAVFSNRGVVVPVVRRSGWGHSSLGGAVAGALALGHLPVAHRGARTAPAHPRTRPAMRCRPSCW